MRQLKVFLTVFITALTIAVQAQQSGIVKGKVLDSDNLSMPGANVIVESIDKGTITDNYYYTHTGIPEETYQLAVSYIGFNSDTKEITVEAGKTTVVDFSLKAGIDLSEVVVSDRLQDQSKAFLDKQMSKGDNSNIISSDQVDRFPDAIIGDALKRITGINVHYDQGEARFGSITGTFPIYNLVAINGERIPGAEAKEREIQLDLVPADMVQAIEVNKALTPDMEADAIGGSANLVTRSAPYDRRISFTLGSGYNILASKPMYTGSFVMGDRFINDKLGVIASASYHNHDFGSNNTEAEWDYLDDNEKDNTACAEEIQIRRFTVHRNRQAFY